MSKDRGKLVVTGLREDYGTVEELEGLILHQIVKDISEDRIELENGVVLTIEESEADCCASGGGRFDYSGCNKPIDAVITDFKIHEQIEVPDSDTVVRRNTITLFHNQNPIINADAQTDAGNGGYYYSVTSLVVNGIHFPYVEA